MSRAWYLKRPLWLIIPLISVPVLYVGYERLVAAAGEAQQVRWLGFGALVFLSLTILSAALAVVFFKLLRKLLAPRRSRIADIQRPEETGE